MEMFVQTAYYDRVWEKVGCRGCRREREERKGRERRRDVRKLLESPVVVDCGGGGRGREEVAREKGEVEARSGIG